MRGEEIKYKVLSGVMYNLSGTLAKHGITFITSILLSRRLNPSDFGLVGMAMVFITFAQGFSDLGLSSGLIQKKEVSQTEMSSVFHFNIFTSLVLSLLLFLSSNIFAQYYQTPQIESIINSISPLFVFNSLNNVHNTILYKNLDIKILRITAFVSSLLAGIVGVSLAYNDFGVWSLIISTYTSTIVSVIVIWANSSWRPSLSFKWDNIRTLAPQGIKAFATNYIDLVAGKIDIFVIGRFFSPTILGYYFRAQSLNLLVTKYSSQSLSGLFFPAISKMNNDKQEIAVFFTKSVDVICFISFLLTGILFVTAEPLIITLFGNKWLTSVAYFKLLAFSSLTYPLTLIFNGIFLGTKNTSKMLTLEIIKKTLNLSALFVGILWNIEIYLWTLALTNMIGVFVSVFFIKKILNQKTISYIILIFKYSTPFLIGLFLVYTTKSLAQVESHINRLLIMAIVFSFSYIGVSFLIKLQGYSIIGNLFGSSFRKIRRNF